MNILKQNIKHIWKYWLKCIGLFASILSIIFLFVSWGDIGIHRIILKIIILIALCLVLLLWSVLWTCIFNKQKIIWENASGRIIVRYGDLLREGFNVKCKQKKIYVIPVNSAFDTIVDTEIASHDKPLVSINSIHGRWIISMNENGVKTEEIDNRIKASLRNQKKEPCKVLREDEKERGKEEVYSLGTVAVVDGIGNNTFYLLASTNFDKDGKAYASIDDLRYVLNELMDFYTQRGQGYELVIPLMGTRLSNTVQSHHDSLRIITSMFMLNGDRIRGDVSVIIYKGDKDKVTIPM